jgi:hypothetical protein
MNARCRGLALAGAIGVGLWAAAGSASGQVIYSDDFSGSSATDLAGTAPDVRPGAETWALGTGDSGTAAVRWKADGSVLGSTTGGGNATAILPFTPVAGNIYELSVELNPTTTDGSGDWLGFGFVTSAAGSVSGNGMPWAVKRGTASIFGTTAFDTFSFLGPSVFGTAQHGVPSGPQPSATDFKIVLNTTTPLWSVEWFIDGASVRTASYVSNPPITRVGIQRFESTNGSVDNFSLTVVPEPGGVLLLGLIALHAMRRGRRAR